MSRDGLAVPAQRPRPGVVIGVDVGGSKILAARVLPDGAMGPRHEMSMPGRDVADAVLEDVVDQAVHAAAEGAEIRAVGVAAAGFLDAAGEHVVFAPHLPWREAPVRDRLARRWQVPVALDNDATCALVAEHVFGAARGRDSAVLVTVGTGIGGGFLVNGLPVRGRSGMAGEYGHMTVVPDGLPCECGGRGCWEQYCSGRALVRAAAQRWSRLPADLVAECEGDVDRLRGPMITRAAQRGDVAALEAFTVVGRWLGAGLANVVAALDPEIVVVGGGVSRTGELLLGPASLELGRRLVGGSHRVMPVVTAATTGAEAGLLGAAHLAHQLL